MSVAEEKGHCGRHLEEAKSTKGAESNGSRSRSFFFQPCRWKQNPGIREACKGKSSVPQTEKISTV